MSLKERIEEEKRRQKEEAKRLQEENIEAEKEMKSLQSEYEEAVLTNEEERLNQIDSRMTELSIQINRRKIKINSLGDRNNPVIQNMIINGMKERQEELANLEEEAVNELRELQGQHETFIENLKSLTALYERSKKYRTIIDAWSRELDDDARKEVGLDILGMDSIPSFAKEMHSLKVNPVDIFGRW